MISRTTVSAPVQSKHTGKWRATFENWCGKPGEEYLGSTVESAPVFATEDEAYKGAVRALEILEATDKFPNMCEPW
jgi:hypothetical protein